MHEAGLRDVEEHMRLRWREMEQARAANRWDRYYSLRRSWLALCRLHGELVALHQEHLAEQLSLLDGTAGRSHDKPPSV